MSRKAFSFAVELLFFRGTRLSAAPERPPVTRRSVVGEASFFSFRHLAHNSPMFTGAKSAKFGLNFRPYWPLSLPHFEMKQEQDI